ncbi:hypothetical protein QX201_006243 [Fusarium graminearum]
MNLTGYLCSPTDKDDIEYRPLRQANTDNAQSYTVCTIGIKESRAWRFCTKWVKPWAVVSLGAILIFGTFILFVFVIERYAIYNFEASGLALADPVENYGDATESAKRWVEDLSPQVSPVMVHSHNDYLRPRPLFSALSVGCASIEADIWLSSNGRDLLVGHNWWNRRAEITLESIYTKPLLQILDAINSKPHANNLMETNSPAGVFATDPNKTLVLFIDVKDDPVKTWPVLLKHLEPLRAKGYLSFHEKLPSTPTNQTFNSRPITVVGTGSIVSQRAVNIGTDLSKWEKYHDVFLDASLDLLSQYGFCRTVDNLCPEVRENEFYTASVSIWRALGIVMPYLSQGQRAKLRKHVQLAKDLNLKSRYWELPAWPTSQRNYAWRILTEDGVDLLNADDIVGATTKHWHSDYTIESAWLLAIVSCLCSFVFTVFWFGKRMMGGIMPV